MQKKSDGTTDRLSSLVFTTQGLHADERIDAWNAAFGSLNEIKLISEGNVSPNVRTENWLLSGGIVLSETKVEGAHFIRDTQRARRDQLDHWILRVIRRGGGQLVHPRFDVSSGPGDIVLFPASDTWCCEWRDVDWVTLCIPRDFDGRLTARLSRLPPGRLNVTGVGLLADLMLALPGQVARAPKEDVPGLTGIVLAAFMAGLPELMEADQTADGASALVKEKARRAILRHIGSSKLTPAFLASAIGVSRSALYRILEAEGGVSRFIRTTRLAMAHAALRSGDYAQKSIARIAEEHGFPDPPDFSRAFRAHYGQTPREVRLASTMVEGPSAVLPPAPSWPEGGTDMAARIYRGSAPKGDG